MPESDFVPTGISGLDRILLGGIRRGNMILVEGPPGSGKSLLGVEFIYRGIITHQEPGLIVVFETDPALLHRDAAAFGWNLHELEEQRQLKIVLTSPQVLEQELRSTDSLLLQTAAEMGAKRIFIDSIALLRPGNGNGSSATGANGAAYRDMLQQLLQGLRREGLTGLLVHESVQQGDGAQTLEIAELLADTVIRLQRGDSEHGQYRTIEILKSRGQDFDDGEHTLRITSGHGLQVYRRVQAGIRIGEPQPSSSTFRSAIGTDALDSLMGGGVYEGSITLVAGPAGSGKSILGTQVLVEGAKRLGKRGMLVSVDEHPAQMLRNSDALDLGMREQVEAGLVHVFHASPLQLEVNVHHALMCQAIEELQIDRLVIDGLTAMRNALNDNRLFRELIHGLMDFTKHRLMTSFLCYETPEVFGVSRFIPDAGITSIVDNIVLLNFVELGDRMHRAISVAKARGSPHLMTTREYHIRRGGISLVPPEADPLPSHSFQNYYNLLSRAPVRMVRNERGGAGPVPPGIP